MPSQPERQASFAVDTGRASGFVLASVRVALLIILLVARPEWMTKTLATLVYLGGEFVWHTILGSGGGELRRAAAPEGSDADIARGNHQQQQLQHLSLSPPFAGRRLSAFQLASVRAVVLIILLVARTGWTTNVLTAIVYLCGEFAWQGIARGSADITPVAAAPSLRACDYRNAEAIASNLQHYGREWAHGPGQSRFFRATIPAAVVDFTAAAEASGLTALFTARRPDGGSKVQLKPLGDFNCNMLYRQTKVHAVAIGISQ